MRRSVLILNVAIAAVIAFVTARVMSSGTNIDKREKHWEKELAAGLKPGATKEEVEAFAKARGQRLSCYQNYKREDQCSFDDGESMGGSRNLPMRLSVIFMLKDNKVVSQQFARVSADREPLQ